MDLAKIKLKRKVTEDEAFIILKIWKYRPVLYLKDAKIFAEDKVIYHNIVNNILDDINKKDHTRFETLLDEFCDINLSFTLVFETLLYLIELKILEIPTGGQDA